MNFTVSTTIQSPYGGFVNKPVEFKYATNADEVNTAHAFAAAMRDAKDAQAEYERLGTRSHSALVLSITVTPVN